MNRYPPRSKTLWIWELVAVRVKRPIPVQSERKGLQRRKCDAETHDQRRGADRQHGKSPLGTFFDIRVHACLRGKANFVPKAARTQTPSDTGASSASTSPRPRASPRARSADIRRSVWASRTSGTVAVEAVLACARNNGPALVAISVVTRWTGRHANQGNWSPVPIESERASNLLF